MQRLLLETASGRSPDQPDIVRLEVSVSCFIQVRVGLKLVIAYSPPSRCLSIGIRAILSKKEPNCWRDDVEGRGRR
jgi:hypothetical protein